MRKDIKKIVAGILSATMLLGTSAMAFADNLTSGGTTSDPSKVEGFVDTDVFNVVVPTNPAADTFKFIIDPQQLISKTDAAAYGGKTADDFESGATVYFLNSGAGNLMSDASGSGTYDYSHISNKLAIVNKSTMAVSVSLEATITSAGDIGYSSDNTFASDGTAANICLKLVNAEDAANGVAIVDGSATSTAMLSGAPDDAYEYFYSDGYSYELTSDAKAPSYDGFAEMKFYVEGWANPNGDFSEVTDATPVLNVVWSVTAGESVEAGNYWDEENNCYWVGDSEDPENQGFTTTATAITSAKLGSTDIKAQCVLVTENGQTWIKVNYVGAMKTAYDAGNYDLTIELDDGITYTTTVE